MENNLKKLIENLEEQLASQQLLLDLAKEKKDYLINGDISNLEGLLKREEEVIMKSGKLEDTRVKIHEELIYELNITKEESDESEDNTPVLSDLIEACEGEEKERLEELFEELTRVMGELKEANQQNNQLIRQSLDYVNYALNLFTQAEGNTGDYSSEVKGDKKQAKDNARRNILDKRI